MFTFEYDKANLMIEIKLHEELHEVVVLPNENEYELYCDHIESYIDSMIDMHYDQLEC